jgi:hypothetical protein
MRVTVCDEFALMRTKMLQIVLRCSISDIWHVHCRGSAQPYEDRGWTQAGCLAPYLCLIM